MDWFVVWKILSPVIVISIFTLVSKKMGSVRFLNALRRFAAFWFVCLGTLAVVATIASIIWPQFFEEPRTSTGSSIGLVIVFGIVAGVGLRMLRMPTYRPDLGDTLRLMSNEPWPEELARRQGRSPWTGDPLPPAKQPKPLGRAI